jgi:hypothetical protein
MKRYRIIQEDFDTRARILDMDIVESWEPHVKTQWEDIKEQIRRELRLEYGSYNIEQKIENFVKLGASPLSILAFHNKFFHQVRKSFVIGSYYPALTGACALGERILNHLILRLREYFKNSSDYKKIYNKDSFDDWRIPIQTLRNWGVLLPEAENAFQELREIRNNAIHFKIEVEKEANDKKLALDAINCLSKIIEMQFGSFGQHKWFIPDTKGVAFIKKSFEQDPFVKEIYLPNCVLVGPYHMLDQKNGQWIVIDPYQYEAKEITDGDFAKLYNHRKERIT